MRLQTVQIVAALLAAIFFILAFMAAGVMIVSTLFMGLALAAIAWLAFSLIKQVRRPMRRRGAA